MFAEGDDDFELDLEMNDLLGEFSSPADNPHPLFEVDIFAADEADSFLSNQSACHCTTHNNVVQGGKKKTGPQHDYAMDSTFISLQQLDQ